MPCDTIQTVQVQWDAKKTSVNLLVEALNELGEVAHVDTGITGRVQFRSGWYNTQTGQMTLRQSSDGWLQESQVKRAYSAQVVKSQARRFGWALKETAPYQYQITKR